MFIPDLGSRNPDPTRTKKGEGKFFLSYLFCSHEFHKIENYFIFEKVGTRKFEPIDKEFNQKLLSYMGLGSGIQKTLITDP
jgi:hypothetical protein